MESDDNSLAKALSTPEMVEMFVKAYKAKYSEENMKFLNSILIKPKDIEKDSEE